MKNTLQETLGAINADNFQLFLQCVNNADKNNDRSEFALIQKSDAIIDLIESRREKWGFDKVKKYYEALIDYSALVNRRALKVFVTHAHWDLVLDAFDKGFDLSMLGNEFDNDYLNAIHNQPRYLSLTGKLAKKNPEHKCNALHYAVIQGDGPGINDLIGARLDLAATDDAGLTPFELLVELAQQGHNKKSHMFYNNLFICFKGWVQHHAIIKAACLLDSKAKVGTLLANGDKIDLDSDQVFEAFKAGVEYSSERGHSVPAGLLAVVEASNVNELDVGRLVEYNHVAKKIPSVLEKLKDVRHGTAAPVSGVVSANQSKNAALVNGVKETIEKWKDNTEKFPKSYSKMWQSPKHSCTRNVKEIARDYKVGKDTKGHVNRHHTDLSKELVKYCKTSPEPSNEDLFYRLFATKMTLNAKPKVNDDGSFNRRLHFMIREVMKETNLSFDDAQMHDYSTMVKP